MRNQIRAGLLMSLESPSARAGQLARQQILWGRPIPMAETVERINRDHCPARQGRSAEDLHVQGNISRLAGIGPIGNLADVGEITDLIKR